ncbi:LysR family transcriptional regulator [Aureimonas fodinaquatilis]|uniref:LysR family transcriptional regulator n=1 Tax=Aureimonas fodinaquatilis TaxID=2565783 RepID=A0A5B0DVF5_9HYPH|nr:LysR family transcriptional regulator [Aureimonas fodinaquatilis]KAA0970456.1 LysR family transcriptional regulator [Aureimonas fodinaquatilis]
MNRPTLQQIEAFFWTATLGSVQKAADRLSLSQPAVSLRLKEFESNIGGPLFERSGRKLYPTQRTRELLRGAHNVLDAVDQLSSTASTNIAGVLKVGFAEGFAMACLPRIIERLHKTYPDIHPELTVATSSSIEPALQNSRLDLAFLVEPHEIEGFTYVYLGLQPTAWVASTSFDLSGVVTPNTLARIRIIANQPGTIGYRQVVRWFASDGLNPAQLDICSSVAIQAKLIEAGTGVGIMPVPMIEEAVTAGRLRILETFPPVQPVAIFLVHRSDGLTAAGRALVECVNETLIEMQFLV